MTAAAVALVVLVVAALSSVQTLLLLDWVLVPFQKDWSLGGARFDATDLVFVAVAARLVFLRGSHLYRDFLAIPYIKLWLLLGVLLSLSYVTSSANAAHLSNPATAPYQLYRYMWKPILYYPLAVLVFSDSRGARTALLAVLSAGIVCSAIAIPQGYAGARASGPFSAGNSLGGALIGPILVSLALVISPGARWQRIVAGFGLLLMIRALLFSASRGAMISTFFASSLLLVGLLRVHATREQVLKLVAAGVAALVLAVLLKPGLFDRPLIARVLSVAEGTRVSTFQWRLQERWPHFFQMSLRHPILGTGAAPVDATLGRAANTPHNGYLATAVEHGYPALAVILSFAVIALRRSLQVYRTPDHPWGPIGILLAALVSGYLIHNLVESLMLGYFLSSVFWLSAGLAVAATRVRAPDPDRPRPRAVARAPKVVWPRAPTAAERQM